MKKNEKNMLLIFGIAVLFLNYLFPNIMLGQPGLILSEASDLIAGFEGFISVSKWDYKQYSWGYGTKAPGPGLLITEQKARAEMQAHVQNDYNYLLPLLNIELNSRQWAALLSFSYNLGTGNADNLVYNINAQDWDALGAQWALYNKVSDRSGGLKVDAGLASRRSQEWAYFMS